MRIIKGKGLVEGETFCCAIKDIKNSFGNRDIKVYFGQIQESRNPVKNSQRVLPKLKGRALILMEMSVEKRRKVSSTSIYEWSSSLYIQIINKKDFSDELRKIFLIKILPEIVVFYDQYIQNENEIHKLTVALVDGEFMLYHNQKPIY